MQHTKLILALLPAVLLSGCLLRSNPLSKGKKPAAVTPVATSPPPAPVSPPPPPAPLSIPQTAIQLPDPQPISAEALATTLPQEEPAQTPAPAPAKPSTAGRPRPAAPAAAPPATPPEVERQPLQEVLTPSEQNRLREEMATNIKEARLRVSQAEQHPVSPAQKDIIDRIMSFLRQADDKEKSGNYRQASELAGRALALARDLK